MRPRTPEQLWALSRRLHQARWRRLARVVKMVNWALHKCLLPCEAIVGADVLLEHYALGVVLHPQVTIGNHCRIFHHVTLAAETGIGSAHRIVLGDHVTIGAHTVVVGRGDMSLTIGDHSVIGAGSVVLRDVPAYQVWAGNPAAKIRDLPRP